MGGMNMMQQISKLSRVIEILRKQLNKDLPSQHIAMLLAVAQQPGITMPELCRQLDMPQGTVSRNVKLMSHYFDKAGDGQTKKGYGLLETDQAETNRYQLSVFLTPEGERLVKKLVMTMGNEHSVNELAEQVTENTGIKKSQVLS